MARASTPTILSLDRWARIVGINPVHFGGGVGSTIWPDNGACADIWPQYSWQTNEELVGREDVAMAISGAEQDIKNALGYSPGPSWEIDEAHAWSYSGNGHYPRSAQTDYGMVIAPGQRAVTAIDEDAAVVYSDPDGDNWDERATVIVSTDLTDIREIKVYFAGHDGEPEWEIRPLRSVTIASGVATILIDAWLLFDPDIWEQYPNISTPFAGLDVTDSDNFVTEVDVYREYNDVGQPGATFYYGGDGRLCCGGAGCDICLGSSYTGCFGIRDSRLGFVTPYAGTYSDGSWGYDATAHCNPAKRVTLSYYAGLREKTYLSRKSLDPLTHYMAEAITWLSIARLPAAVCNCNNIRDRIEELQKDMTTMRDGAAQAALYARFPKMDVFNNPLGTKFGEVKAWQRVTRLQGELGGGAVL